MKTLDNIPNKLNVTGRICHRITQCISRIPLATRTYPYNITICKKHRFIWFRVAKVGTRTIYEILKKKGVPLDVEHPHNVYYSSTLYKTYYKFAFVRNPWDRLVSCWMNKVVNKNLFLFNKVDLSRMKEFSNFVHYVSSLDITSCNPHLRLQSKLIDLNNLDHLGRFENFSSDLCVIFREIGINIKIDDIPKMNVSLDKTSYHNYYNKNTSNLVNEIYKNDINLFNYKY